MPNHHWLPREPRAATIPPVGNHPVRLYQLAKPGVFFAARGPMNPLSRWFIHLTSAKPSENLSCRPNCSPTSPYISPFHPAEASLWPQISRPILPLRCVRGTFVPAELRHLLHCRRIANIRSRTGSPQRKQNPSIRQLVVSRMRRRSGASRLGPAS